MTATAKPRLTFWQIWNMCFGFLGIQFGFALQNANVSRIFQSLGAGLDQIPALWIAAPLTGLVVQPLIGAWSDRTWTRLGRRRPFFLVGAILASLALLAMPRSGALWIAAGLLWMLDSAINVAMEPFRALVGDQLPVAQRPTGYAMQSFFIGVGSVVASMLPWLLQQAGVSNVAAAGAIPDTVRWSFDAGAVVLFGAVLWTILGTREYAPQELQRFDEARAQAGESGVDADRAGSDVAGNAAARGNASRGAAWCLLGVAGGAAILALGWDRQLLLLCAGAIAWGAARLAYPRLAPSGMAATILRDLDGMPPAMRRLVPVQFFSWLALFAMWIYTTPAVAQRYFGASDPASAAFNEGANWVGVLFAAYNGYAALAAVLIPLLVRRLGLRAAHLLNLFLGAAGLASFLLLSDPHWLLASMIGVGFAWASILSLPYALLSDSVPARKMGVYMGIFNFFIVIPQLVAASVLGVLLRTAFGGAPIYALLLGAACFLAAGLLALRVPQPD